MPRPAGRLRDHAEVGGAERRAPSDGDGLGPGQRGQRQNALEGRDRQRERGDLDAGGGHPAPVGAERGRADPGPDVRDVRAGGDGAGVVAEAVGHGAV